MNNTSLSSSLTNEQCNKTICNHCPLTLPKDLKFKVLDTTLESTWSSTHLKPRAQANDSEAPEDDRLMNEVNDFDEKKIEMLIKNDVFMKIIQTNSFDILISFK